jgi:hypothetical protein
MTFLGSLRKAGLMQGSLTVPAFLDPAGFNRATLPALSSSLQKPHSERSRGIPKAHRIPIHCRALKYYQRVPNRHAGRNASGFGPLRNKHL